MGLNGAGFVHLHVASAYSLRYGIAAPAALAARAAEHGMPALALTDRDGLYGAVKHAVACSAVGISPILGADLALAGGPADGVAGGPPAGPAQALAAAGAGGRANSRATRSVPSIPWLNAQAPARLHSENAARVTVLAAGRRGWASLCHLVSAAHQAGQRGAPVITPDLAAAHAGGLIILLGPGSDVGRAVTARRPDLAAAALARWRERAEVVIEITDHRTRGSLHRAARMLRLAHAVGVPAVLSNAVRYLDPADAAVAQVLDAARQLTPLGKQQLARNNGQAYLASGADMAAIAARVGDAAGALGGGDTRRSGGEAGGLLRETAALAQRCALDPHDDLGIGGRFLPDAAGSPLALLRARCAEGLRRQFPAAAGTAVPRARRRAASRLDHELAIIGKTGLASYFLTVADVTSLIRSRGIRCSIRGSGAGCLVNYLIGISGINPLDYDLIMERFLAESRQTLPDIDLDVESARRIEAYRAIIDVYGEQRVACVSMMETYRARSALRDVAASLGLPPHEIDAVAKAFPRIRAAHIRGALAELPELRASGLAIPQLTALFQLAERLDGLPRHVAMHPCGVLLSNLSLLDRTAVERSFDGLPLSQLDKDDAETAGVIKLDVLGVRMQSAMAHAVTEIERTRGERVDLDAIDRGDGPTFEMIRGGRTLGCFQIESPGQRELVVKLLPRDVGDLIVDISLFRPGPVNSDMITPYLEIRHGQRPACYPDDALVEPLSETGGVIIFHEQVLRVIDVMTGCGLSEAERRRRQLSDERSRITAGEWFRGAAVARGFDARTAARVWEVLEAFGGFGFCKAHAAAFAIPTYQSAWLKRHYPAAFYAGLLTHDPGMYPKRVIVGDARLSGVPVLPVDANVSAGDWRVEYLPRLPGEGLRTGLREVKGISDGEVAGIVAGQPYASLRDFWERAGASRPVAERLILVGAFDSLYGIPEDPAAPDPAGPGPAGPGPAGPGPAGPGLAVPTRRDLLARLGVLDRRPATRRPATRSAVRRPAPVPPPPAGRRETGGEASGAPARPARRLADPRPAGQLSLDLGPDRDGFAGLVPAGELRELTAAERVEAELEILGIDLSRHVLNFYDDLLSQLGVVRSAGLHRCRPGSRILVAGVKIATQTPAIRSGMRIIFATLDDATGPVDLAFFESVQDRCAARVFGSWLLVARGRVRRAGGAVSVNGEECWDLTALEGIRLRGGIGAVRAAMAAGDVPAPGALTAARPMTTEPGRAAGSGSGPAGGGPGEAGGSPKVVFPNGFTLSPYAETGSPGGPVKDPPRKLWHASPGSSG